MEDALDDHGLDLALEERRAEAALEEVPRRDRWPSRASGRSSPATPSCSGSPASTPLHVVRRGRNLARQLPDEDKPWT